MNGSDMSNSAIFPTQHVGDFTITAISDGYLTASLDLLSNIDAQDASRMQRAAGQTEPGAIHINSYVVRGAGRTLLIDAGQIFGEDVDAAAARLDAMERNRVTFFEEPFHGHAYAAYAGLRDRMKTVVSAGGEAAHDGDAAIAAAAGLDSA